MDIVSLIMILYQYDSYHNELVGSKFPYLFIKSTCSPILVSQHAHKSHDTDRGVPAWGGSNSRMEKMTGAPSGKMWENMGKYGKIFHQSNPQI